jgi:hypothetical protein
LNGTIQFVGSDAVAGALAETSVSSDEADAIIEAHEDGQPTALRMGLLAAAAVVVGSIFLTRRIPDMSFEEMAAAESVETGPAVGWAGR